MGECFIASFAILVNFDQSAGVGRLYRWQLEGQSASRFAGRLDRTRRSEAAVRITKASLSKPPTTRGWGQTLSARGEAKK
jgi:hypothetical protein